MCGIVGYIGKRKVSLNDMVTLAYSNRHRGEDGIGMLYMDNDKIHMEKYLYSLEELYKLELNDKRALKRVRIGSVELTKLDEDGHEKMQDVFSKKMKSILSKKSKFIVLHHRKSTYGNITLKNQHPIYYKDKYYIHNGTASEFSSLKNYLEVFEGHVFETETDTEVLAVQYNKLKVKFKGDKEKIIKSFNEMFKEGFGVLIEVDKKGNVTIFKDNSRRLWVYETPSGYLFISEPLPYTDNVTKFSLLGNGIQTFPPTKVNAIETYDYTKEFKLAQDGWENCKNTNGTVYSGISRDKCEYCDVKKSVVHSFGCEGHPLEHDRNKVCFECLVMNAYNPDLDSTPLEEKKSSFGRYIGEEDDENRVELIEVKNGK